LSPQSFKGNNTTPRICSSARLHGAAAAHPAVVRSARAGVYEILGVANARPVAARARPFSSRCIGARAAVSYVRELGEQSVCVTLEQRFPFIVCATLPASSKGEGDSQSVKCLWPCQSTRVGMNATSSQGRRRRRGRSRRQQQNKNKKVRMERRTNQTISLCDSSFPQIPLD
jgi:hypothetical protein